MKNPTTEEIVEIDPIIVPNTNPGEEDNPEFKANYNGTLWHDGFAYDDIKQKMVQYAYKLGGFDFVKMIECENGNWDIHAIGDSGHAFGLCQMNDRYHKNLPSEYFTTWQVQVELCYQKYTEGTKFYGPKRWVKGKRCHEFVEDRFTLVE